MLSVFSCDVALGWSHVTQLVGLFGACYSAWRNNTSLAVAQAAKINELRGHVYITS